MPRIQGIIKVPMVAALLTLLAGASGCGGAGLGQIDESRSERDDMRGPGILADDSGETVLKWSSDKQQAATAANQATPPAAGDLAEFEQFKEWNRLRTEGRDSAEYREFLQWLKYQEFKAGQ